MAKRIFLTAAIAAAMATGAVAQTDVSAVKSPSAGTGSSNVTMSGSGKKMKTAKAQTPKSNKMRAKPKARSATR